MRFTRRLFFSCALLAALPPIAASPLHAADRAQWLISTPGHAFAAHALSASQAPVTIEITSTERQRIDGFGGAFSEIGWNALVALAPAKRDEVMRALFDEKAGCGFVWGRVPLGASDFALGWYSGDETDDDYDLAHFSLERDRRFLIPFAKAAKAIAPKLRLFASPWSPPSWMKEPKVYNYGTLRKDARTQDAYARYLARYADAYWQEGLRFEQLHVQNEPTADQKFPSCRWRGAELRDFIRDRLGPLLQSRTDAPQIWLGTINSEDFDEYANTVLSDPKAAAFVKGVGYQWAGKLAIQRTHAAFPALPLMQTESECGDGKNTWDFAQYVFTLVHHYFTNGASAYVYWNMVLPPDGRSSWGWRQNALVTVDPAKKTITYNPEFTLMKHFARYVPPGSVLLDTRGPLAGNALAFRRPDGTRVLVVANPLSTPRDLIFDADGARVAASLPASSLNTIVVPAPAR